MMRAFKSWSGVTIFLMLLAAEARAAEVAANAFKEGRMRLGAGFDFASSSYGENDATYWDLNFSAPLQFFIMNRLAVGGKVTYSLTHQGDATVSRSGLGPAATYYFWNDDRFATYVAAELLYKNPTTGTTFISTRGDLGLDYFLTPIIAVGPTFTYEHYFKNDDVAGSDFAAFGIAVDFLL